MSEAAKATDPEAQVSYPIAPNGIFWSLQGEAHLRGFQMGFIRLAGCSVRCPGCDTNYQLGQRMTVAEITTRAFASWPHDRDQWVWITGGEPTDHDLGPLLKACARMGWRTALATSGCRPHIAPVDWLSVSPHTIDPAGFRQRYGNEVKLVDGLKELDLAAWIQEWDRKIDFMYRYVQPLSRRTSEGWGEDPASLERCLKILRDHPRWALSRQDHHVWSVS